MIYLGFALKYYNPSLKGSTLKKKKNPQGATEIVEESELAMS